MEAGHLQTDAEFSPAERHAVCKCIFNRRDVRGQFLSRPIPYEAPTDLLVAAHHAPSVSFMQPWDLIVVEDAAVKLKVRDASQAMHMRAAEMLTDDRQRTCRALRLEGTIKALIGICVTCDRSRTGSVAMGRIDFGAD